MNKERYLHRLNLRGLGANSIPCIETGKPALLVLDMQNYFLDPGSHAFVPSAPDLVQPLRELAELFESRDLPVIYTKHGNTPENAGAMARKWRTLPSPDDPMSGICCSFDTSWSAVVEKTQYDAFLGTPLQSLLEQLSVTAVVVTGLMTDLCCETTARAAFTRGYDVVFPVNGTATLNMELHRATTLNLSHGFTPPVSIGAVRKAISRGR